MIANWHDAMQGLETAKKFCATFHIDNENRIRKTAEELGLSQKEYAAQLSNHYEQIPDVAHLQETLDLAIDILSKITYRKKTISLTQSACLFAGASHCGIVYISPGIYPNLVTSVSW